MVCAPDFDCQGSLSIRFAADGTVQTTDGHSGSWKLFDPDGGVYSLAMGRDRWSLKLVPWCGGLQHDRSVGRGVPGDPPSLMGEPSR